MYLPFTKNKKAVEITLYVVTCIQICQAWHDMIWFGA
jgi:hypothetical protein